MATGSSRKAGLANVEAEKARWLGVLDDLVTRVEGWAKEMGWSTRRISVPMSDSQIGPYTAPALLLQEAATRIILEPIARSVPGAEGAVDLYIMPAYDDVARLFLERGEWIIYPFSLWYPDKTNGSTDENHETIPLTKASLSRVLLKMMSNVE